MTSYYIPNEAEMLTVACSACGSSEGIACSPRPPDGLNWEAYWDLGWQVDWLAGKAVPAGHTKRSYAWMDVQMWRRSEALRLADEADVAMAHREGYDEFEDEHGNDAGDVSAPEWLVTVHRKADEPDRVRDEDNEPEVAT